MEDKPPPTPQEVERDLKELIKSLSRQAKELSTGPVEDHLRALGDLEAARNNLRTIQGEISGSSQGGQISSEGNLRSRRGRR